MLRLERVRKNYKVAGESVPALKGITVNFRESEFVSVLGPSGCGKTTLLNIIGGLDKYTSGDLVIGGRSTKEFKDRDWDVYRNHRIGFIFQSYNLIPHQTVLGNVELALTIAGVGKAERRRRAKEALAKVGLADQMDKRPNQLSGGQCQRVAIARALVNDPEILLADEPTGALDSKTSVQIMELMKEIASEKLVIMVTHNPELAEQYSTRIISMRDGKVIGDTDPYTLEEEKVECKFRAREQRKQRAKEGKKKSKEKAKMGARKAFALSARNLLAKKGRTIMVGIAGSIGIIGVAIVLAFSSGIQAYINDMETDMLSGFPVSVSGTALDFTSLLDMTNLLMEEDTDERETDKVYVNKVIETMTTLSGAMTTNDITKDYIDFLQADSKDDDNDTPDLEEYTDAIRYSYGIEFANNIYTEYVFEDEGVKYKEENESGEFVESGTIESKNISIAGIRSTFASVLGEIEEYAMYTALIDSISTFSEIPNNEEYIMTQYDVVAGEFPDLTSADSKDKLILVLNSNAEINDLMIAQFGYVSAREMVNYAFEMTHTEEEPNVFYQPNKPHMADPFDYSHFVGDNAKTFTWYPNDVVFTKTGEINGNNTYRYNTYSDDFSAEDMAKGIEMEVACILKPHDSVQYGMLSSGMYYTKALTDHVRAIETNEETMSEVVKEAKAREGDSKYISNVTFTYEFYYDKEIEETGEIIRNVKRIIHDEGFGSQASEGMSGTGLSAISAMMTREEFAEYVDTSIKEVIKASIMASNPDITPEMAESMANNPSLQYMALKTYMTEMIFGSSDKVVRLNALGGAELPTRIQFYTDSFDDKDMITAYLDKWNDEENGYILGEDGEIDHTKEINYNDTLGVIMTMVNTLITMITVALVVFTSISLVVSTVMIGIITYVSVVERIKEIGVIRAMGGRKRDIKNLFTAETTIIGLLAGIIGIAVTYTLSFIGNTIIGAFSGIYTLASLNPIHALIMVGISVFLTLISGLLPASKAAKQDPVVALRTE